MATPDEIDTFVGEKSTDLVRRRKKSKAHLLGRFIYNKETSEVLGRSRNSWLRVGGFLAAVYVLLVVLAIAIVVIVMVSRIVGENEPSHLGSYSTISDSPGLGFRPMPFYLSTLIKFTIGQPSTYKAYVDQLQAFLEQYSNAGLSPGSGGSIVQCQGRTRADLNQACEMDINDWAEECSWNKQYGFDDGIPCIFLKVNKVYGWVPEPYTQQELDRLTTPEKLPDGSDNPDYVPRGFISKVLPINNQSLGSVAVSCHGIHPLDDQMLGGVDFYPPTGFRANFFPYLNQDGYRQPGVMVQFNQPEVATLMMVRCRLWAKNIRNRDFPNKEGSVTFELMID